MNMVQDALWELFCDTGDPLCYLLSCALRRREKENDAPAAERAAGI